MKKDEDFAKLARGNVANILNFYYENNQEVPPEIIKNIKFNEEFKKVFEYKINRYENRHHIEESNAINCLKYLDFKAYSKYMDINWVCDNGVNGGVAFVRTAIFHDKKEALTHSLELVKKEIKKENIIKDFSERKIENYFFRDALDLTTLLNVHTEYKKKDKDLEFIVDFFKKSLEVFSEYYHEKAKIWKSEYTVNFSDWHKNHDKLRVFFSNFNRQESLTEELIKHKKYFHLCKEAFEQYKDGDDNPFVKDSLVVLAMKSGNINYLNLLYKNNKITDKDLSKNFNVYLGDMLEGFKSNFTSSYRDYIYLPKLKEIKQIETFLQKNSIHVEYSQESIMNLLVCDNKESKDFLISNINNLEHKKIKDELTIGQLSFLDNYIKEFQLKFESKKKKNTEQDIFLESFPTFEIYLVHVAKDLGFNYSLTKEQKQEAIEVMCNKNTEYLNGTNFTENELKSLISKSFLEDELTTNQISTKKMKI